MAHNSYLLSPVARGGTTTFWPDGGTVYSEDFTWFAVCCFQSINGDLGGTWSPSTQIILGGSGLQLVGPFQTGASTTVGNTGTDTLTINSFATFVNGWQANSTSAFHYNVTFDAGTFGSATVTSDSHVNWTINGALVCGSSLQVSGNFAAIGSFLQLGDSFGDTLTINATETHNAGETHNGVTTFAALLIASHSAALGSGAGDSLVVNATETHNCPETHNGLSTFGNTTINGVLKTPFVRATSLPATLGAMVRNCIVYCPVNGSLTLSDDGGEVVILNRYPATTVSVYASGGGLLWTLSYGTGSGNWVKFVWNGSSWESIAAGSLP